jgi:hypothetical protein
MRAPLRGALIPCGPAASANVTAVGCRWRLVMPDRGPAWLAMAAVAAPPTTPAPLVPAAAADMGCQSRLRGQRQPGPRPRGDTQRVQAGALWRVCPPPAPATAPFDACRLSAAQCDGPGRSSAWVAGGGAHPFAASRCGMIVAWAVCGKLRLMRPNYPQCAALDTQGLTVGWDLHVLSMSGAGHRDTCQVECAPDGHRMQLASQAKPGARRGSWRVNVASIEILRVLCNTQSVLQLTSLWPAFIIFSTSHSMPSFSHGHSANAAPNTRQ